METWTTSGLGMNGCPAWVCPSIALTSWNHWWMPACSITSPRKSWGVSWKWWTASTGMKEGFMGYLWCGCNHFLGVLSSASSHLQGESSLWYHVLEALELWQEGAGEKKGREPASEPRWALLMVFFKWWCQGMLYIFLGPYCSVAITVIRCPSPQMWWCGPTSEWCVGCSQSVWKSLLTTYLKVGCMAPSWH